MYTGSIENEEEGVIVYSVYSRRSQGLSVGVNLFPDEKHCPFDCPYCEVFPFRTNARFDLDRMERELGAALARNPSARDISFSGSGEPAVSPDFPAALETASRLRDRIAPAAALVVITNGAGLLDDALFGLLAEAASGPAALRVWLKVDAGTEEWYRAVSRARIPYRRLREKIKHFASRAPFIIQTMLCRIQGAPPPEEEVRAWESFVAELVAAGRGGAGPVEAHLYGKARPAPEDPHAEALPASYLADRAASLTHTLATRGLRLRTHIFP
jgi:histidinol dehydrogenase